MLVCVCARAFAAAAAAARSVPSRGPAPPVGRNSLSELRAALRAKALEEALDEVRRRIGASPDRRVAG